MAAITIDTTAEHIKPLEGAIVRRYTAGAAITAGYPVAIDSSGYVQAMNTTDATLMYVIGVALNAAAASGDKVDVVVHGPVICVTDATPGGLAYGADATGFDTAVGTKDVVIGYAVTATTIFVRPQFIDAS